MASVHPQIELPNACDAADNGAPSEDEAMTKVHPTANDGHTGTPLEPDVRSYDQARTPRRYSKRQCEVQRAEFRAMALLSLNELYEFATEELAALHLFDSNPRSSTHQKRVTTDLLNMYHLCDFFVKPLTLRFRCSFMEISAGSKQTPLHFVSHAWSTALRDTLSMLNYDAQCHKLTPKTTFYW